MKASKQVKIVVVAILVALAVIVIFQNMTMDTVKLLFAKVEMPRGLLLLLVTLGIGYVIGLITSGIWFAKRG